MITYFAPIRLFIVSSLLPAALFASESPSNDWILKEFKAQVFRESRITRDFTIIAGSYSGANFLAVCNYLECGDRDRQRLQFAIIVLMSCDEPSIFLSTRPRLPLVSEIACSFVRAALAFPDFTAAPKPLGSSLEQMPRDIRWFIALKLLRQECPELLRIADDVLCRLLLRFQADRRRQVAERTADIVACQVLEKSCPIDKRKDSWGERGRLASMRRLIREQILIAMNSTQLPGSLTSIARDQLSYFLSRVQYWPVFYRFELQKALATFVANILPSTTDDFFLGIGDRG